MGIVIYAWCVPEFARGRGTKELVVRGLYRFTRNPIYKGILGILLGEVLLFRSSALLSYTLGTVVVFHLFRKSRFCAGNSARPMNATVRRAALALRPPALKPRQ